MAVAATEGKRRKDVALNGLEPKRHPYPRTGTQFFANSFLAHMFRSCVALEIGPQAALLLTVIALTEDKARYRRGVRFWNEQLTAYLGCRESRLIQLRKKLVDGGWLHYQRGSNFQAGTYWVLVPGGDACVNDNILGENAVVETDDKLPESAVCEPDANYPKAQFVAPVSENKLRSGAVENAVESAVILPMTYDLNTEEGNRPFEFVVKGGRTWILTPERLAEYQTTFPGKNVIAELMAARLWCKDHPSERKTERGMPKFLTRWLLRSSNWFGKSKSTISGKDWARITAALLRSPSQVLAWFGSQSAVPINDENRCWCLAMARDAVGPKIDNPAALFVNAGKKLARGERHSPSDDAYDWAKSQLRLWRAQQQTIHQQGDYRPTTLQTVGALEAVQ